MSAADPVRANGTQRRRAAWVELAVACFAVTVTTGALGQSAGLPPTAPTGGGAPTGSGASRLSMWDAVSQTSNGAARHRAAVILTQNRLEVRAENSSLNAILREIAAQTGMTITGGVLDQRVFGTYGPGAPAEVLSELLQDTGTNMILRMNSNGSLAELTISPRMGGPTPPGPSTFHDEEANQRARVTPSQMPAAAHGPPLPAPAARVSGASTFGPESPRSPVTPDPAGFVSVPTAAQPGEQGTPAAAGTQPAGTTDANSGSNNGAGGANPPNPQSPNGVKTPQQIYEELQKLQQQLQK